MTPGRTARVVYLASLSFLLATCARVQAPSPPSSEPALSEELTVIGVRLTVAAKAARTLALYAYTTKRFGSDSTWGYRAVDAMSVRLRYTMPVRDSTRVVVEYWGRCERGGVACMRGELAALAGGITQEEVAPQ
ncbi:MAG: hypothetical protein H7Z74_08655 [Anaerolineae bacterium]|nr:hypothetical protein [Gemmatimonadaceae bacterium]